MYTRFFHRHFSPYHAESNFINVGYFSPINVDERSKINVKFVSFVWQRIQYALQR